MTPPFSELNLNIGSQKVLIVEDDRRWRNELTLLLSGQGHDVEAYDGIARLAPSPVVATLEAVTQEIDLGDYDVAFLDYYFLGSCATGGDLTEVLATIGRARIMGMSSDSIANARMLSLGAHSVMRKSDLRASILGLR